MLIIRIIISKLRYLFATIHRHTIIYSIKLNGKYLKDTRISNSTVIENEHNLVLGENVFIGHFNFIEASNKVTIEEGCQITNFISILSHSSHNAIRIYGNRYRYEKDLKTYVKGEILIGKYSFIGPHALIMPSTKIGNGSIVQAYSYVKGTFPDFSIIGGNPARIVGDTRKFDERLLRQYPELTKFYEEWAKN